MLKGYEERKFRIGSEPSYMQINSRNSREGAQNIKLSITVTEESIFPIHYNNQNRSFLPLRKRRSQSINKTKKISKTFYH